MNDAQPKVSIRREAMKENWKKKLHVSKIVFAYFLRKIVNFFSRDKGPVISALFSFT
jgi:hypothetical protein